jgi:hypothetical protein
LVYIIEELMPRDYYTNMLSLRADIVLVHNILQLREKKILNHFKKLTLDLSIVVVESFLTIFTNTLHPSLVDVIFDHFLLDGSLVLIKALILILETLREQILEINGFGRPG